MWGPADDLLLERKGQVLIKQEGEKSCDNGGGDCWSAKQTRDKIEQTLNLVSGFGVYRGLSGRKKRK